MSGSLTGRLSSWRSASAQTSIQTPTVTDNMTLGDPIAVHRDETAQVHMRDCVAWAHLGRQPSHRAAALYGVKCDVSTTRHQIQDVHMLAPENWIRPRRCLSIVHPDIVAAEPLAAQEPCLDDALGGFLWHALRRVPRRYGGNWHGKRRARLELGASGKIVLLDRATDERIAAGAVDRNARPRGAPPRMPDGCTVLAEANRNRMRSGINLMYGVHQAGELLELSRNGGVVRTVAAANLDPGSAQRIVVGEIALHGGEVVTIDKITDVASHACEDRGWAGSAHGAR